MNEVDKYRSIQDMLIETAIRKKKEASTKSPDLRACLKCGEMLVIAELTPSQQKYKKYVCHDCEALRKQKYRKVKHV